MESRRPSRILPISKTNGECRIGSGGVRHYVDVSRVTSVDESDEAAANESVATEERSDILGDIVSGLGLGALLGVLVGMSVSPVVSTVVSALVALLAVFLGLEHGGRASGQAVRAIRLNAVRIGSFGLATVLGILLGVFLRSSFLFQLTLEDHMNRWNGFPSTVAQQLVIFERTGLRPKKLLFPEGATEVESDKTAAIKSSGVLVGFFDGARDFCEELDPSEFGNDPERILKRYEDLGKEDSAQSFFSDFAKQVRKIDNEGERLEVLTVFHEIICRLRRAGGQ